MEFKKLVIENFRNFSSIEIDLSNKIDSYVAIMGNFLLKILYKEGIYD